MAELKIGVIGGGQLARMMVAPALQLGFDLRVLSETDDSPAIIAATLVGDYRNLETVRNFADSVSVVTFDHEHVPIPILETLEASGVSVQPPSKALRFAQNKLEMRRQLESLKLPMPAWRSATDASEVDDFVAAQGGVAIAKTPIGGYDGRGVRVIRSAADVADWLEADSLSKNGGAILLEQKVEFVRELAQLSARSTVGEFACWPLVQTTQRDGICFEVLAPAPNMREGQQAQAQAIARAVAEGLGVTGVLAVELFETADAQLLINELAMRPHNSGHFSIEGSATSQFEQHLRAISGLPLGPTNSLRPHAVMVNLLGVNDSTNPLNNYSAAMSEYPQANLHSYHKAPRAGRKLGHVTAIGDDLEATRNQAQGAAAVLLPNN